MSSTPEVASAAVKSADNHVSHVDYADQQISHLANMEDHNTGVFEAIRKAPRTFFWCLYGAWCLILSSFENMAGGNVIGIPQFRKDFGKEFEGGYVLEGDWQSAINGAPVAAVAIGTLGAAWLADKIGRKYMLLIGYIISFVGITLEVVATSIEVFFVGKCINGLAIGIYTSVAVSYVGEIAPLALRGIMTAICAFAFTFGPFIASLIMNYTSDSDTRWAYRALFCSQYGFAAVGTVLWVFMPESPWWLLTKNKQAAAEMALRALGVSEEDVPKRIANIKTTLDKVRDESDGATYLECFRFSNLRRTIISIAPLSIQALCGVTFIGSYFTYYVQLAGYSTKESFNFQIAQQTLSMFGNIISWFLIDRVGRRDLTFWGLVGLTVLLMLTGGLATRTDAQSIKGVVALELVYVWWYNLTIGATAYALLAETATARLRVKSVAIGVALQNGLFTMWAFVLPYIFNPDQANLGAKSAFIFGGISVFCMAYVWVYQPETAGRTYEELDEMFIKRVPARKFKTYKTDAEVHGEMALEEEKKI